MPHLFLNSSISQGLLIFIHTAGRKTAGKRIFNTVYILSGTQSTCGDAHAAWLGTEQVGDQALCPGNTAMGTGWLKHPTICWPNWSSCCRVCNCEVGEATSTACKMMPPATLLYPKAVLSSHGNGPVLAWIQKSFICSCSCSCTLVKAEQLGGMGG